MNTQPQETSFQPEVLISMKGIYKAFPNVQAVDDGTFELRKGEIHSLIGENGAGKSTLMKILYGLYHMDSGEITVRGERIDDHNTAKAIKLGIGMVHQEFMLVKEISVLENIILGYEPTKRFGVIDLEESKRQINKLIKSYHLDIQLDKLVNNISVGEMQRVEIIKTQYRGADILILDEPTGVLTPQETVNLFQILKHMRDDGKSIVFISHKLKEVMEISDRITVMRNAKYVGTVLRDETSPVKLARMMVGRDVLLETKRTIIKPGNNVLEVKDLVVLGERSLSTVKSISFNVKRGEILGIAGVEGNGQTELVEAITGLRPSQGGSIKVNGKEIQNLAPDAVRDTGVSHIPEDRNLRGICRDYRVEDNLAATRLNDPTFINPWWINQKKISDLGKRIIKKFDIRPANGKALAGTFSGGNAQKIVVAREIEMDKDLLIAAQPTRGVDVGSIESIRFYLNEVKASNKAVLLVSADLDEILALSDRILVLHEGSICGEMDGDKVDIEKLGMLMTRGSCDD